MDSGRWWWLRGHLPPWENGEREEELVGRVRSRWEGDEKE